MSRVALLRIFLWPTAIEIFGVLISIAVGVILMLIGIIVVLVFSRTYHELAVR